MDSLICPAAGSMAYDRQQLAYTAVWGVTALTILNISREVEV